MCFACISFLMFSIAFVVFNVSYFLYKNYSFSSSLKPTFHYCIASFCSPINFPYISRIHRIFLITSFYFFNVLFLLLYFSLYLLLIDSLCVISISFLVFSLFFCYPSWYSFSVFGFPFYMYVSLNFFFTLVSFTPWVLRLL